MIVPVVAQHNELTPDLEANMKLGVGFLSAKSHHLLPLIDIFRVTDAETIERRLRWCSLTDLMEPRVRPVFEGTILLCLAVRESSNRPIINV
jgi:hypothetical protein